MAMVQHQQRPGSTILTSVGRCCRLRPTVEGLAFGRTAGRGVGEYLSASVRTERQRLQVRDTYLNAGRVALQIETLSDGSDSNMLSTGEGEALCSSMVFKDEAKGIYCYRTESGEVTCEGIDEGPHFNPPHRSHERPTAEETPCCKSSLTLGPSSYRCVKEGRAEMWCEGKDES